jgi:phage recombination protein Bet
MNNDTLLERQLAASVQERSRTLAVVPRADLAANDGGPLRFSPEQERMIRDTCANGASSDEFAVLLEIARVRRLNPLLRQIHFVKRWDKNKNRHVWSAQISIDGMRAVAQRTGRYNGQDEPEYGPCNSKGFPEWAKVRVYRKDWDRPAVGLVFWREYVQTNKDGHPTSFWSDMPMNQLAKCAEAHAFRKAFPEDCGGLYTDVEMEQATHPIALDAREEPRRVEDPRRQAITVHGRDSDEPPLVDPEAASEALKGFRETLSMVEDSLPGCLDYQGALILRDLLGSVARPSQLTRDIQAARESGLLSISGYAELSKTWLRCNRQLCKLEKDLPPPDVTASFIDSDEDEVERTGVMASPLPRR